VLRALDKLAKIGPVRVAEELQTTAGATGDQAREVLALVQLTGSNDDVLKQLEKLGTDSELGKSGVARLREVILQVEAALREKRQGATRRVDRPRAGLYTGLVVETTLDELPDIGSVCSGGRYDNLAEVYTNQELPGIGASLGLDRLLAAMEELGKLKDVRTPANTRPLFRPRRAWSTTFA